MKARNEVPADRPYPSKYRGQYAITRHAGSQMQKRGFTSVDVGLALSYGRLVHARGATRFVIGRKELRRIEGLTPRPLRLNGLQVVTSDDKIILTVYRNANFRGLRCRRRRSAARRMGISGGAMVPVFEDQEGKGLGGLTQRRALRRRRRTSCHGAAPFTRGPDPGGC